MSVTPMMENIVLNLQITLLNIKIYPILIAAQLNEKSILVFANIDFVLKEFRPNEKIRLLFKWKL